MERYAGARRVLRGLGAASAVVFVLAAFTPLPNRLYAALAPRGAAGSADAIVALGAAVDASGTLSEGSLRRAVEAVRLKRAGRAPLLVLLGARLEGPSEAEVRATLARELGIPEAAILTAAGLTTRGEARAVAELLQPQGVRRVLLVTSATHMPRARAQFAAAGFEVLAAPVDDYGARGTRPWRRIELARKLAQELAARALYRVTGGS